MNFLVILGLVFLVLKLVGVIAWSWVWVLCPFLLPALVMIAALVFLVIAFVAAVFFGVKSEVKWKRK